MYVGVFFLNTVYTLPQNAHKCVRSLAQLDPPEPFDFTALPATTNWNTGA